MIDVCLLRTSRDYVLLEIHEACVKVQSIATVSFCYGYVNDDYFAAKNSERKHVCGENALFTTDLSAYISLESVECVG